MRTENSEIQYRKLGPDDLKSFRDLNVVFGEAFEDPETHFSKKPKDEYLLNLLSQRNFIALCAFSEGKVIGGLIAYVLQKYEQERSEIFIYDLAVTASHRRKGIARGLISSLKTLAQDYRAWVIFVQADRTDAPAVKLYESLGVREEPFHFDISVDP